MYYDNFLQILADEVASQPEAVRAFARLAVRAVHGHWRANCPLATVLITGPPGTGKGLLIQTFTRTLLGSERRLIKINSSFHRHALSCMQTLHQACAAHDRAYPPGSRPLRIVLVDSLEKATGSVIDLLIHIFANGEMSPVPGTSVDFSRTIFILETTLAEREVDEMVARSVGFRAVDLEADDRFDTSIREQILSRIYRHFAPRFLSVVDEIVLFRHIREDDLPFILDKQIGRLSRSLATAGIYLHVEEAARNFLLEEGRLSLRYGAKGLRQATDRHLETPLAAVLATTRPPPGSVIYARRSFDGLSLFVPMFNGTTPHAFPAVPQRMPPIRGS